MGYSIRRGGLLILGAALVCTATAGTDLTYPIVDTGQTECYGDRGEVEAPGPGRAFHGQDAQYVGLAPSYRDNGDGTVTDLNTGLMWQQDAGGKMSFAQAKAGAEGCRLGGYRDWRLPRIKELYSLIDFTGSTGRSAATSVPYIDTDTFAFQYGDVTGERFIDSQFCSSTEYVHTTMGGNHTVFGVNFADGRIKCYPSSRVGPGQGRVKLFHCLHVRGNPEYGKNDFADNGDGTITDFATGLTWTQKDSGHLDAGPRKDGKLNWQEALAWAEGLEYAGHSDWRLPNVKELQGIVDYTRSPETTQSPAIDPLFESTLLDNGAGVTFWGFYWSGTTHLDGPQAGQQACYVAFGKGWGYMWGQWLDVHGAGCQRSDPKSGDPSWFPQGRGPQGDSIRIYNLARCVRDVAGTPTGQPE